MNMFSSLVTAVLLAVVSGVFFGLTVYGLFEKNWIRVISNGFVCVFLAILSLIIFVN